MSNINKLLVNHIKSLYNTAFIISKKNNVSFIPLPKSKVGTRQELFNYANILNEFIKDPVLLKLNNDYKQKEIKNKKYSQFPDEIIKLKYKQK